MPKKKKKEEDELNYPCDICGKCFRSSELMKAHKKIHNDLQFPCSLCSYVGKTKKYLSKHIAGIHEQGKKIECDICKKRFTFPSKLKHHMLVHTGEKPYICNTCGKAFNSTYSLNTHKFLHTGEKPFHCAFCPYACRDSSTLRKHQNRHKGIVRVYQCTQCPRKFEQKCDLKLHVAEVHLNVNVRLFKCEQCEKGFKTRHAVVLHVKQVHEKAFEVKCEVCGKVCSNPSNLLSHMRTHTDRKPYPCPAEGCAYAFRETYSLKKHMVTHNDIRPFCCDICGRAFRRPKHVEKHLKMHMPRLKEVQCDYCSVKFYSKNYLIKHMKDKHNPKKERYECDECGFKSGNKPGLVMHLRAGHDPPERECKICHTVYRREIYMKLHYLHTHGIRYNMPQKKKKVKNPVDLDVLDIVKHEIIDDETQEEDQSTLNELLEAIASNQTTLQEITDPADLENLHDNISSIDIRDLQNIQQPMQKIMQAAKEIQDVLNDTGNNDKQGVSNDDEIVLDNSGEKRKKALKTYGKADKKINESGKDTESVDDNLAVRKSGRVIRKSAKVIEAERDKNIIEPNATSQENSETYVQNENVINDKGNIKEKNLVGIKDKKMKKNKTKNIRNINAKQIGERYTGSIKDKKLNIALAELILEYEKEKVEKGKAKQNKQQINNENNRKEIYLESGLKIKEEQMELENSSLNILTVANDTEMDGKSPESNLEKEKVFGVKSTGICPEIEDLITDKSQSLSKKLADITPEKIYLGHKEDQPECVKPTHILDIEKQEQSCIDIHKTNLITSKNLTGPKPLENCEEIEIRVEVDMNHLKYVIGNTSDTEDREIITKPINTREKINNDCPATKNIAKNVDVVEKENSNGIDNIAKTEQIDGLRKRTGNLELETQEKDKTVDLIDKSNNSTTIRPKDFDTSLGGKIEPTDLDIPTSGTDTDTDLFVLDIDKEEDNLMPLGTKTYTFNPDNTPFTEFKKCKEESQVEDLGLTKESKESFSSTKKDTYETIEDIQNFIYQFQCTDEIQEPLKSDVKTITRKGVESLNSMEEKNDVDIQVNMASVDFSDTHDVSVTVTVGNGQSVLGSVQLNDTRIHHENILQKHPNVDERAHCDETYEQKDENGHILDEIDKLIDERQRHNDQSYSSQQNCEDNLIDKIDQCLGKNNRSINDDSQPLGKDPKINESHKIKDEIVTETVETLEQTNDFEDGSITCPTGNENDQSNAEKHEMTVAKDRIKQESQPIDESEQFDDDFENRPILEKRRRKKTKKRNDDFENRPIKERKLRPKKNKIKSKSKIKFVDKKYAKNTNTKHNTDNKKQDKTIEERVNFDEVDFDERPMLEKPNLEDFKNASYYDIPECVYKDFYKLNVETGRNERERHSNVDPAVEAEIRKAIKTVLNETRENRAKELEEKRQKRAKRLEEKRQKRAKRLEEKRQKRAKRLEEKRQRIEEKTQRRAEKRRKNQHKILERARQRYNERMKMLLNKTSENTQKQKVRIEYFKKKSDEIRKTTSTNKISKNNDASDNDDQISDDKIDQIDCHEKQSNEIGHSGHRKKLHDRDDELHDCDDKLHDDNDKSHDRGCTSHSSGHKCHDSTSHDGDDKLHDHGDKSYDETEKEDGSEIHENAEKSCSENDEGNSDSKEDSETNELRKNLKRKYNVDHSCDNDGDETYKSDGKKTKVDDNKPRKLKFNTHQCYVCFKLFKTKEDLIDHCKNHFDICSDKVLKKCPLCPFVGKNNFSTHMKVKHNTKLNILYGSVGDRKDNSEGSRYYYKLENNEIDKIEIIPSVKHLNRMEYVKIDEKKRLAKENLVKNKLVKKGKEWIVQDTKININTDEYMLPKFDDEIYKKVKVKETGDIYADNLKKLSHIAKKEGKKMLFPCKSCDKICRNLSALTLHLRKHDPNAKPFKKKVWKHKIKDDEILTPVKPQPDEKVIQKRFEKPKPIVNKHKCDPQLKEFYEKNIRGSDIEFWQFLKIFNKMSREDINDFIDLEGRHEYGMEPDNLTGEESNIEKTKKVTKNKPKKSTKDEDRDYIPEPSEYFDEETQNCPKTRNKIKTQPSTSSKTKTQNIKAKNIHDDAKAKHDRKKNVCTSEVYKRVIRISKKEYEKRKLLKEQLRETIAMQSK